MELNYKKVPSILTNKDLDYLKDMFNWNNIGYKLLEDSINKTSCKDISDLLKEIKNNFYDNMNVILDLIKEMEGNNERD
jgi:hypothetical protein